MKRILAIVLAVLMLTGGLACAGTADRAITASARSPIIFFIVVFVFIWFFSFFLYSWFLFFLVFLFYSYYY